MEKLVSVIIPIFNAEKTLNKCISSLLNQSYKNIEVIAVNDGSTDKSAELLDNLSKCDKRLKVIHRSNQGVSASRNIGIKLSTGSFITFVDIDDWIDDTYIEVAVSKMNQGDLDCIYFNYYENYEGKSLEYVKRDFDQDCLLEGTKIVEKLLPLFIGGDNSYKLPPMAVVWRGIYKSVLVKKNICFNENVSIMEDLIFNLQFIGMASKILLCEKAGYHYYLNENSTTQRYVEGLERINEDVYTEILSITKNLGVDNLISCHLNFRKNIMTIANIKNESLNSDSKKKIQNLKYIINRSHFVQMDRVPIGWYPFVLSIKFKTTIFVQSFMKIVALKNKWSK
ncbi:glycosyltransferase family 2 protein [Priestia megaterium]|uniref:glycosyltransferase family 2 protein n=1 Tax=Priestia megaterium TaxID=1404 RepID=UPI0036D90255